MNTNSNRMHFPEYPHQESFSYSQDIHNWNQDRRRQQTLNEIAAEYWVWGIDCLPNANPAGKTKFLAYFIKPKEGRLVDSFKIEDSWLLDA